jgi:hypothetical protein
MNGGISQLAPDGPDLAPITKVVLLKLPCCQPTTVTVGPTDDGPPIGSSVHCRSDADRLAGSASYDDLKPIADLKIVGRAAGHVRELHHGTLADRGSNNQRQGE